MLPSPVLFVVIVVGIALVAVLTTPPRR